MKIIENCDKHGEVEFIKTSNPIFNEVWECKECNGEKPDPDKINVTTIKLPEQMKKITKYHIMNDDSNR